MAITIQRILNLETTVASRGPSWRIHSKDPLYTDSTTFSYLALFRQGPLSFLFLHTLQRNLPLKLKKLTCYTPTSLNSKYNIVTSQCLANQCYPFNSFTALCIIQRCVSRFNAQCAWKEYKFLLKAGSSTRFLKIVKNKLKKSYILLCISSEINIKDFQSSVKLLASNENTHLAV